MAQLLEEVLTEEEHAAAYPQRQLQVSQASIAVLNCTLDGAPLVP
jgi:hypothetical protein